MTQRAPRAKLPTMGLSTAAPVRPVLVPPDPGVAPMTATERITRDSLLRRLPLAHAVAVRLHEQGADDELIAVALDIEVEGVDPLLAIAHAKLRRLGWDAATM